MSPHPSESCQLQKIRNVLEQAPESRRSWAPGVPGRTILASANSKSQQKVRDLIQRFDEDPPGTAVSQEGGLPEFCR